MNLKNNFRKRKFTNNGGITLIALVITIIVLLILAAISISMLSGDNSILNRATQAKNVTGEKQIQEKIRLAVAGAIANGNGSITEDLLRAELNKQFGENGYDLIDKEDDSWDVKVGEVIENVKKSGAITGGGAGGGNNTLVLTATDRATESRAAIIKVTQVIANATPETELQPMFVDAIKSLGAPFSSWNDISHGDSTMTVETAFNDFNMTQMGYSDVYDLIIKTGANNGVELVYPQPATFTLNGETITGTSAEFVVTKNSSSDNSYTISATQGGNSGSVTANVTKCKIEEYSTICENNTNLKVGTNGRLEPASSGDTVVAVCPAGFAYGTSTNVGTVATGLVITDHVEEVTVDRETKRYSDGNEFVWIPVDKTTLNVQGTSKSMATATTGTTENLPNYQGALYSEFLANSTPNSNYVQSNTDNNREPAILSYDTGDYSSQGVTEAIMQGDYNKMIQSVKTYGGFYVGRYEMGIEGTESNKKCISKIGVTPTSAYDSDTSMWYGLYSKAKTYTNSKNSVTSGMIWGSQYDAMLNFGLTNSIDSGKITANTNGNHSGKLLKTGTWKGSDSINNIFDLEGNLFEWTQEADNTYVRVGRGGIYNGSYSPSSRGGSGPNDTNDNFGSRLGLYIR